MDQKTDMKQAASMAENNIFFFVLSSIFEAQPILRIACQDISALILTFLFCNLYVDSLLCCLVQWNKWNFELLFIIATWA